MQMLPMSQGNTKIRIKGSQTYQVKKIYQNLGPMLEEEQVQKNRKLIETWRYQCETRLHDLYY